jgi:hypothetical protein
MKFPGDPYFKFLALKQYGPPPDQEQQALLISGLPSAIKIIKRSYGNPPMTRLGTCILNNLSSPEARGSVGTVAQEKTNNIMTTPIRTAIKDFIITNLLSFMSLSFFSLSPDLPPSVSPKTISVVSGYLNKL